MVEIFCIHNYFMSLVSFYTLYWSVKTSENPWLSVMFFRGIERHCLHEMGQIIHLRKAQARPHSQKLLISRIN